MQFNYLKKERSVKFVKVVLLIMGIIFFLVGLIIGIITITNYQNAEVVNATIIDILYSRSGADDTTRTFLVKFIYNNQEYTKETSFYSSFYHIGDTIKLYINNGDVNKIWSLKMNAIMSAIFGLIGLMMLIICITLLLKQVNNNKLKDYLKSNGSLVEAKIIKVEMNNLYSINGIHPFNIICEYEDRFSNEKHLFKSVNIWDDPSFIIKNNNIEYLNVYIDNRNKKKYYVELDNLIDLMKKGIAS